MKKSSISFQIELDDKNIPEKITWLASDTGNVPSSTKAMACSVWDEDQRSTLKIDLWTKEMQVAEMEKFFVDTLGGLSQTILNATGDSFLSNELNQLCNKFTDYLEKKSHDQ